ncbi:hypothetical protein BG011_002642 [Mortierella polycephala]|uniref:Uncharacterized protein n=1 Tax=Mortierella polycephala TaxID=41804 RepID=A0A9P6Q5I6_9FUNG|nr:hypothetical protein BG011_002642 [Mortierella polycephala]
MVQPRDHIDPAAQLGASYASPEDHQPHGYEYSTASEPITNDHQVPYTEEEHEEERQQETEQDSLPTSDTSSETFTRLVEIVPQQDLVDDLHGEPGFENERAVLSALERLTDQLITSRKALSEKQRQLIVLHINDSRRIQAEVQQLLETCRNMEQQWITDREAYYRDYVLAAAAAAADRAAKARAELKAKTEQEIRLLQDQIANLQRQLDAVAARRKQMYADAQEQDRIMRRVQT